MHDHNFKFACGHAMLFLLGCCVFVSPVSSQEKKVSIESEETHEVVPDQGNESALVPIPEVVKRGNGPVQLLLIPCMSGRWNQWEDFMERNQDDYSMIAVTLPGFGGTAKPNLPMNTDATPWRDNIIQALSQLVDEEDTSDLIVVGHSWGTMIAVQFAAARPDVVTHVVAVDGSIESTTWTPEDRETQLAQARQVVRDWGAKFQDANEWHQFNGVRLPEGDFVPRDVAMRAIKMHGAFVATPKEVLLQYWRENPMVDVTAATKKLSIPILDIKCLSGETQEENREQHLADLKTAGVPAHVQTVFLYDTRHFVMFHRPEVLDDVLASFVAGRPISDYQESEKPPAESATGNATADQTRQ